MIDKEEYEDIKSFFDIQSDKVRRNAEILSSEDVGQDFMLHIDRKTPNYFIPQMPRRAANSEDNTTPRVTVSDNLIGCMIGYSEVAGDFLHNKTHGLYINKLNFNYCLGINDKLVFDSSVSGECWLVPYNKDNLRYKPETIGKMFVNKITFTRDEKRKYPLIEVLEVLIAIEDDITIRLNKDHNLSKGFYRLTVNLSHLDEKDLTITIISQSEFMKEKNVTASMLNLPISAKW